MKSKFFVFCAVVFCFAWAVPNADAGVVRGLTQTVLAPFELPKAILQGGLSPTGLVGGALTGTARTVSSLIGGVGQMAQGTASTTAQAAKTAAPYAKYAPLFLL